jgi:acyl-CoA reductase-like NAD-dependent aldehyde dehydrogenase
MRNNKYTKHCATIKNLDKDVMMARSYGEVIPCPVGGKSLLTVHEPLGVAALITPWNFPIGMAARKVSQSYKGTL